MNGFLFLLEFFSSHTHRPCFLSLSLSHSLSLSLSLAVRCLLCRHLFSNSCSRLCLQLQDNFPTIFRRPIPISIPLQWSYCLLPLLLLLSIRLLQQLLQQPMTPIRNQHLWLFQQNVDTSLMFPVLVSDL